jgi:hypothetical protein
MKKNNVFVSLSVYAIRKIWQRSFGVWYNKKTNIICRFHPSCSDYGILALEKHGFIRGWVLTYDRIKRCNKNNTESCIDYP